MPSDFWVELNGFGFACECGARTFVETVTEDLTPTPMEFTVTCRRCGGVQEFNIMPEGSP